MNNDKTRQEVDQAMLVLKTWCSSLKTCDKCRKLEKYKGCYFRQFKTPREWEIDETK